MFKQVVSKYMPPNIPKGKLITLNETVYELFRGRWCDGYGFYFLRDVEGNTAQTSYVAMMTDTAIDLRDVIRIEFMDTDPSDNVSFMRQMTKRYFDQEKAAA